jgi:hypothetical protein
MLQEKTPAGGVCSFATVVNYNSGVLHCEINAALFN